MEISSIFFDDDLDYLEQHQIETLLQILKSKYGEGTRIKATGDSSFEYSCSCPVHEDGRNPNGRVAFADDGNLRLYCNGACSVEGKSTWYFGPLLERLGADSGKLARNVRDRLTELKKEIPPRHLHKLQKAPAHEDHLLVPELVVPDLLLAEFLKMAQNCMSQAHRDDLKELGYGEKTISRAGFLVGSPAQYQELPGEFQGKRLNEFRNENQILKKRVACFIFPHFNRDNKLWSLTIAPIFKGQTELENNSRYASEGTPKSYKLKGSKAVMDGLETLSAAEKLLSITEGIKDADSIRALGRKAVATLGGVSMEQAGTINSLELDEIHLCYDADLAGRGKTQNAIWYFIKAKVSVLDLPEGKDPNDLSPEELKQCAYLEPDEWAAKYGIQLKGNEYSDDTSKQHVIETAVPTFSHTTALTDDCYPKAGFIPLYLEYARPLTEARDQFHLATALAVLSIAYERRIYIQESSPIFANLYLAIVGYSSASKKSTSIGIGLKLLKNIFPERTSLSNVFTPEGLQSAFEEYPRQLIEIDELGGFLGQVSKKSYMSGISDILNSLYDCPSHFVKRLAEKTLEFDDPYPVVICGSPFRWLSDEANSTLKEGGFMARFQWFITLDRLKKEDLKPITPAPNVNLKNKLIQKLEDIQSMEQEDQVLFTYDDQATELYCRFYEEQKLSIQNEQSEQIGPYVERLLTSVKKFALIYEATKGEGKEITKQTMREAIALCRWLRGNIEHLFQDHFHESKTDELCHKTLKALKRMSGGEKPWCTLREITQNVRELNSKNKTDIIETLIDKGLIQTKAGSKKKGPKEDYRGWLFKPAD
tara:strand:- start:607 stop:3069 length:2463 start_codon:yes stop_codon:yes gene_type:complete